MRCMEAKNKNNLEPSWSENIPSLESLLSILHPHFHDDLANSLQIDEDIPMKSLDIDQIFIIPRLSRAESHN